MKSIRAISSNPGLNIFLLFVMAGLLSSSCGLANGGRGIFPEDGQYDWSSHSGIPGGIPIRSTVFRTMTPSSTAAEISAAIAACPSGQIVHLMAGVYDLGSDFITFPQNKLDVTLRGAGPGLTIITGSGSNIIRNASYTFKENQGIALARGGGYTKGSTSIKLFSAPTSRFIAGNLIVISEEQSPDKFDRDIGIYARDGLTSSVPSLQASRCFRYLTRIESVNDNTITLATPLPLGFAHTLNPKAYALDGPEHTTLCGIEDITFFGCESPIRFYATERCWFKNLEFSNCPGCDAGHIQLNISFQPEVRRCYIHDVVPYPETAEGIGIGILYGTCNGLFVDNISNRTSSQFICSGSVANAFIHNLALDCTRESTPVIMPGLQYHGPHVYMNLIEGNIWPLYCGDGYHGSASHNTIFRNHLNGLHSFRANRRLILNLCRGSYYESVVGNVLGDPSWQPTGFEKSDGGSYSHTDSYIYVLGYPNAGNCSLTPAMPWSAHPDVYPDPAVASTLLRHGNYDFFHNDVVWDDAISSRDIPASLFYSSKPTYFGSLLWPPIGPDVGGMVTPIPAKVRWDSYIVSGVLADLFRN